MSNLLAWKWLQNLQFLLVLASNMHFFGNKWANNQFKNGLNVRRRREFFALAWNMHFRVINEQITHLKRFEMCAEGAKNFSLSFSEENLKFQYKLFKQIGAEGAENFWAFGASGGGVNRASSGGG